MSFKLLKKMCNIYNRTVRGPEFIGAYFSKTTESGKVYAVMSIKTIDDNKVISQNSIEYKKSYTTAQMRDLASEYLLNEIATRGLSNIKEEPFIRGEFNMTSHIIKKI